MAAKAARTTYSAIMVQPIAPCRASCTRRSPSRTSLQFRCDKLSGRQKYKVIYGAHTWKSRRARSATLRTCPCRCWNRGISDTSWNGLAFNTGRRGTSARRRAPPRFSIPRSLLEVVRCQLTGAEAEYGEVFRRPRKSAGPTRSIPAQAATCRGNMRWAEYLGATRRS